MVGKIHWSITCFLSEMGSCLSWSISLVFFFSCIHNTCPFVIFFPSSSFFCLSSLLLPFIIFLSCFLVFYFPCSSRFDVPQDSRSLFLFLFLVPCPLMILVLLLSFPFPFILSLMIPVSALSFAFLVCLSHVISIPPLFVVSFPVLLENVISSASFLFLVSLSFVIPNFQVSFFLVSVFPIRS